MLRKEILEAYEVKDGIIVSPGKFENEPVYAPHFWNHVEFADEIEEIGEGFFYLFIISEEDLTEFPELSDIVSVRLWEDDNGFVFCRPEQKTDKNLPVSYVYNYTTNEWEEKGE